MEVDIGEVVSSVRAVDGNSLLSPQILEKIVQAVTRAVSEQQDHQSRVDRESRVTRGVQAEMEEDWT